MHKEVQGRRFDFSNIVMANIVGFLLILQYCTTCSLVWAVSKFLVRCSLFLCDQHGIRGITSADIRFLIRKNGYNLKHVLLVGYSRAAEQYMSRISRIRSGEYNVEVLGDNMAEGQHKGIRSLEVLAICFIYPAGEQVRRIAITLGLENTIISWKRSYRNVKNPGFIPSLFRIVGNVPTRSRTRRIFWTPVIIIRYAAQ